MAELTAERRNKIARILLRDGSIRAADMAELFHVSTETIRKDIIYLEENGIAEKNHGGATAKVDAIEKTLDEKDFVNEEAKNEIASKVMKLVPEHATILLDAGSTTNAIAKQLLMRSGITVFTNSLSLVNILADSGNTVYMTGGRIRKSSHAAVGGWAIESVRSIHADFAFLGSDGFRDLAGPSTLSYEEAEFKRACVLSAAKAYTVADSSKVLRSDRFQYCSWPEITGLITAGDHEAEVRKSLTGKTQVL